MLWAITSYFNPFGCSYRLRNFKAFRRTLTRPLVVVEVASRDLQSDDAAMVVHVPGDHMWQKERGLNLALGCLPRDCDKVLWIDSDVLSDDINFDAVSEMLDHVEIVQPFTRVQYANVKQDGFDRAQVSVASLGPSAVNVFDGSVSYGIAWAARRAFLERFRFYDRFVVGGGDVGFAAAVLGMQDVVPMRQRMTAHMARCYLDWAEPVARHTARSVRAVGGTLTHLWHGSIASRKFADRHKLIAGLDPYQHVYAPANSGLIWSLDCPLNIRDGVEDYLGGRAAAATEDSRHVKVR